jgi:hypothetical protein
LKAYSLQLLFLGFAILSLVAVFQYTEIRENGILLDTGDFYHWKNVESFAWTQPEQRLLLRLRNFFLKKQVKLAIHSYYKKEIAESFEQYTSLLSRSQVLSKRVAKKRKKRTHKTEILEQQAEYEPHSLTRLSEPSLTRHVSGQKLSGGR